MRPLHLPSPRLPPSPVLAQSSRSPLSPGKTEREQQRQQHAGLSLSLCSSDTAFGMPPLPEGGAAALPMFCGTPYPFLACTLASSNQD